ncbi:MAG: hypothetical protein IT226_13185 [Flavobacteriales bacterium]|nr:hypothetical protein [Flavobacteriales bacterium]
MIRSITLCALVVSLSASAQPTLDQRAIPVTGSIFGYHDIPFLPAGRPGIAMKWDLSALPYGTIVPYQWTTTDIAPGAGAFPAKALVLAVPGEPTSYYQAGDTALYWLGAYSDNALVRFDPPLPILDLPCSYLSAWSDSGVAAVTGAGRIDMRMTSLNAQADSYGTLVMPYGIVNNVLRVRYELTVTSKADPKTIHLREVRYAWYCDQTPMPLLLVVERFGWPPPERYMRWLDGSWRDDPAALFRPVELHPFPDPCEDQVVVDLPALRADRTVIQLVDAGGQISKQWSVEFTSPEKRRMTLSMTDVPSGQYTLSWIGTNGTLGSSRLTKR